MKTVKQKQVALIVITPKGEVINARTRKAYKPSAAGSVTISVSGQKVTLQKKHLDIVTEKEMGFIADSGENGILQVKSHLEYVQDNDIRFITRPIVIDLRRQISEDDSRLIPKGFLGNEEAFIKSDNYFVEPLTGKTGIMTQAKRYLAEKYELLGLPISLAELPDYISAIQLKDNEPKLPIIRIRHDDIECFIPPGYDISFNKELEYVLPAFMLGFDKLGADPYQKSEMVDEARAELEKLLTEKRTVVTINTSRYDRGQTHREFVPN